jgi:hypothetical protein
MNIVHSLTLSEKELLEEAITLLEAKLKETPEDNRSMDEHHKLHDIEVMRAFLRYDVSVTMTKKQLDNFSYINAVDFPIYVDSH